MLNPKQCVLYSGGAAGTEQFFGALAEGWGIEEVNYSFEGHQIERKRGVRVLTSEELALKDVSLTYVSKLMNREYTRAPIFRKVLQSICWQVSSGNQVIVICRPGSAEGVGAAIDAAHAEGVLGSIAGDDTLLVITQDDEAGASFQTRVDRLLD